MKNTSLITAIESSTLFNDKMLVDFVTHNLSYAEPSPDDSLPVNFSTLVWASSIMPVKGNLEIMFKYNDYDYENKERVNIPVNSFFFITCTKEEAGNCRVAWSNSLS